MYARSTTARGNPQAMDDVIAFVRDEVMPQLQDMPGFVGLSMLADREAGQGIVTSTWDSRDAMQASGAAVRGSRDRAGGMLGDTSPEVQEWEVAAMHRAHETGDGACVRLIWCRAETGHVDRILQTWRTTIPPQLESMPGFCSVSVLIDRERGRAVSAVSYADRQSMDASADRGLALRDRFAESMEMEITDVAEYDLVLAHLRVPELV